MRGKNRASRATARYLSTATCRRGRVRVGSQAVSKLARRHWKEAMFVLSARRRRASKQKTVYSEAKCWTAGVPPFRSARGKHERGYYTQRIERKKKEIEGNSIYVEPAVRVGCLHCHETICVERAAHVRRHDSNPGAVAEGKREREAGV